MSCGNANFLEFTIQYNICSLPNVVGFSFQMPFVRNNRTEVKNDQKDLTVTVTSLWGCSKRTVVVVVGPALAALIMACGGCEGCETGAATVVVVVVGPSEPGGGGRTPSIESSFVIKDCRRCGKLFYKDVNRILSHRMNTSLR